MTLVTSVGIEISIQNLLRIDEDYLALRGRLAGSTDMGRAFLVPYDQIHYLGSQKEMKEAQIHALYGWPPAPAEIVEPKSDAAAPAPAEAEPPTDSEPQEAPAPAAETSPPQEPPHPTGQLKIPRKSGLLQRLRARAQTRNTGSQPGR